MNAVIIYEQSDLALKARAMLEHAAHRPDGFQWQIHVWRLESVLSSAIGELPLHDAVEAHLIVFAMSRPASPEHALLQWLKKWAECRTVPDAALAIFDGTGGAMLGTPLAQDLAHFAACHGLSILAGDESPTDNVRKRPHRHRI